MKQIFLAIIFFCLTTYIGCNDTSTEVIQSINFKKVNSGVSVNLYDVNFIDATTGYIVGDSGVILKTTDKGENWSNIRYSVDVPLNCISFSQSLIFIGGDGIILSSSDNGSTWENINIIGTITDISFNKDNVGIAVGGFYSFNSSASIIYATTDNGSNWIKNNNISFPGLLSSTIILSDETLLITSSMCFDLGPCDNRIIKSTDYGKEFKSVYNANDSGLYSINSYNGSDLIATGNKGKILFSADKGESWTYKNSNTNSNLYSVFSISNNNYYAVGENGTFIVSNNKGQSWSKYNVNSDKTLRAIYFLNSEYGIVVGDDGTIIKITFE